MGIKIRKDYPVSIKNLVICLAGCSNSQGMKNSLRSYWKINVRMLTEFFFFFVKRMHQVA